MNFSVHFSHTNLLSVDPRFYAELLVKGTELNCRLRRNCTFISAICLLYSVIIKVKLYNLKSLSVKI